MKPSEVLYGAADYIRKHGFSPAYVMTANCPTCFLGALDTARPNYAAENALIDVLGGSYEAVSESTLKREQWGKRDAIAALTIAADICAADGK